MKNTEESVTDTCDMVKRSNMCAIDVALGEGIFEQILHRNVPIPVKSIKPQI